jgi:DNA-binding CsgD family transcriptional regulator
MLEGRTNVTPDFWTLLSPREEQVLELTSRGLTNNEIADSLSVSVHAVKFHLGACYRKLGVANRTEAANAYLRAVLESRPARREADRST